MEEDAILSRDVQLAALPYYDDYCPRGNVLTLSGWGYDPYLNPGLIQPPHHILWAVKQECLNINDCNRFNYLPNNGPILCVGDRNDPRNGGYKGDSGGKI